MIFYQMQKKGEGLGSLPKKYILCHIGDFFFHHKDIFFVFFFVINNKRKMSSTNENISWTHDIEKVLENIRINSIILSREHKRQYMILKNILKYYRLPVIILSACNSVISVSAQPYLKQAYISLITCALALVCGIIGSVELYFQLQLKMETELTASKDFYILSTDIYKMLNLDAKNRSINGKSFLDNCYSQYVKMIESSCVLVKNVEDKLTDVLPLPCKLLLSSSSSSSDHDVSTNEEKKETDDSAIIEILLDPPF